MDRTLSQDIKDIRGQLLCSAGTDLEEWSKTFAFSKDYEKRKTKFKEAPEFVADCRSLFEQSHYDVVLKSWTKDFREWLGEMWAPSVIFEELRLMKQIDAYTYRHVLTIAVVGARMLEIWIRSAPTVKRSFQALICHRLGKNRLSEGLLQKSGALSEVEKRAIYEQPMVGFVLNATYWGGGNHLCAKMALQHQEDRAGLGYPMGIKTNSLMLDILRLIDRFDALTSERPFRYKKFSARQALDILQEDVRDGKMEEDVLKAFTDLIRKKRAKNYKKIKLGMVGREESAAEFKRG